MRDVLDPVLSDLQRPHRLELELRVEPRGDGGVVWVSERGGAGAAGRDLPDRSSPRVELLVSWAAWMQEQVFPEASGAWGEARPECPGHPHPASAVELDHEAWWVCPVDGRRVGRIGQLGDPRDARSRRA
jgi:hypothetical protein